MPKTPPIPHDMLERTLSGERYAVIAGFMNIIIIWIDRGVKEPMEEDKLERLSGLPTQIWARHGTRVKTLLESFYGPFIEYWDRFSCKTKKLHDRAVRGYKGKILAKLKRENDIALLQKPQQEPLKDEKIEFSIQPHRLERTHERTTRFVTDTPRKSTPPAPFKPGLKDV